MKDESQLGKLEVAIRRARGQGREELHKLLESDPKEAAALFKREPVAFAEVLARAAQDTAGGGMSDAEMAVLVEAFARQPALLARLLSGMGA